MLTDGSRLYIRVERFRKEFVGPLYLSRAIAKKTRQICLRRGIIVTPQV
jgi:hypothetical protein